MAKKARSLSARRKFNGKSFTKKGSHKLKSAATKSAAAARKGGKDARVVKHTKPARYTVYTRG